MKTAKRASMLLYALLFVLVLTGCAAQSTYKTVQEYVEAPITQALLEYEISNEEDTGFVKTIRADGNTLIYEYTFEDPLDLSDPETQARVQTYLQERCIAMTEDYAAIAAELSGIVEADEITIRLIYKNTDGSEIYAHEYK